MKTQDTLQNTTDEERLEPAVRELRDALIECIRLADRPGAGSLLEQWAKENGYERLLSEVLEPTLLEIGEAWVCSGQFSLAQMCVAARVVEDAMGRIAEARKRSAAPLCSHRPVVIGNIQEDFHALGRRLVGTFLGMEGWTVHDLGNDVPASEFVDKAVEVGARVIGVSAMMMTTARTIRTVREELDRRGLSGRIQLAVGGAVFLVCPGLAEEVGGDGTAPNALAAPALFETLWQRAVAAGNPG